MKDEKVKKLTNKPDPAIGSKKVYQKKNKNPRTDYWYCEIENRYKRHEFMFLDFSDLTPEDLLYYHNGIKRKFKTANQRRLRDAILNALNNKPESNFVWIQVCEPTINKYGDIVYNPEQKITRAHKVYEWEDVANNYLPENGSQLATTTIYYLLLLRWLKDGWVNIKTLADNSSHIGRYRNSKHLKKEFAGLKNFVGNTTKIVKDPNSKSGFSLMGGTRKDSGFMYPVSSVYHVKDADDTFELSVGLIILQK